MAAYGEEVVYYSPSSMQYEHLREFVVIRGYGQFKEIFREDMFVLDATDGRLLRRPSDERIKESPCTPVFNLIFNETDAECIIHSHSKCSNLLTQLLSGKSEFRISDQEMIKGIIDRQSGRHLSNMDCLTVPIVENTPEEFMLIVGPRVKTPTANKYFSRP